MSSLVTVNGGQPQYDKTVAFATGTTSSPVDLGGETLLGIIPPTGMTATTFTVQVPTNYTDGVVSSALASATFVTLTDETGTDVTITVTADDEHICFSSAMLVKLRGVRYLRFLSGASQTATITLVTAVI
jgi:hypothetical protein